MAAKARKRREAFGRIEKRASGRYRAAYIGPDDVLHRAPATFATITDARVWLAQRQAEIAGGTWEPAEVLNERRVHAAREAVRRGVTLGEYAARWIDTRTNSRGEPLRPRTVESYENLLRALGERGEHDAGGPLAALVSMRVVDITPQVVREWRADQVSTGRLTQTSRAYDLLKSVLKTAVEDELIATNPCRVKGGSTTSTGKMVEPPTDDELATIIEVIDPRYRALVILAAIGGLRWGEATELRAKDLTVERDGDGVVDCVRVAVERQVVYTVRGGRRTGDVKSLAGVRTIAVFGADARLIAEQVRDKIGDALLFTSADGAGWVPQSAFWRHWHKAVVEAGRRDLPFHALRHYAGTRYAQAGATIKETMARLGHSSTKAAMRYQHAGSRDDELARRMRR